jgi:hypothetical protein
LLSIKNCIIKTIAEIGFRMHKFKILSKKFSFCLIINLTFITSSLTQTFNIFEADFTIKEKYKSSQKSTIFKGSVLVNAIEQSSSFDLYFPTKEKWILKDSLLTKYTQDSIIRIVNIGDFNNFSLIREISSAIKKDYGLSELGFSQVDVKYDTSGITTDWSPPEAMKVIFSKAVTIVAENLLQSVTLFDIDGKIVTTTFFEDYIFIKNYPIPSKILSKVVGDTDTMFKSLVFKNISINHK